MKQNELKSNTGQRGFTMVFNDFLDSDLLNKHEKLLFIAIKRFADNDTKKAFPSLKTLHRMTGISIRWIKKCIDHMEEIGVISVEHREDAKKGHQSNIYTLYDHAEIWKANSSEEVETVKKNNFVNLREVSTEVLLMELERRNKEKMPGKTELAKGQLNQASQIKPFDVINTTTNSNESQGSKRYSLDEIRHHYDYDVMVNDYPHLTSDIDQMMDLLKEVLNTTKPTIRISGENKRSEEVIYRLWDLKYPEILHTIEKFKEQTGRIKNTDGYILRILYSAARQTHHDITNRVQHDMANWGED